MTYENLNDGRLQNCSEAEFKRRSGIMATPEYQALNKRRDELLEQLTPLNHESTVYDHAYLVACMGGTLLPGGIPQGYHGRPIEQIKADIKPIRTEIKEIQGKKRNLLFPPKKEVIYKPSDLKIEPTYTCPGCGLPTLKSNGACYRCGMKFTDNALEGDETYHKQFNQIAKDMKEAQEKVQKEINDKAKDSERKVEQRKKGHIDHFFQRLGDKIAREPDD